MLIEISLCMKSCETPVSVSVVIADRNGDFARLSTLNGLSVEQVTGRVHRRLIKNLRF